MTTVSLALVDPASTFSPRGSAEGYGEMIDDIRADCGFVIRGIDWVCRQFGFDLVAAIFEPIAGEYGTVDAMAENWAAMGEGLGQVGDNYRRIAAVTPSVWTGAAAERAVEKFSEFAEGFTTQAEAAGLMHDALKSMLRAAKAIVSALAECLSLLDLAVMKLVSGPLGVAAEILSGGKTVRRCIELVQMAIRIVGTLREVIPPLLMACQLMAALFKGIRVLFQVGSAVANSNTGNKADDVAGAGF